MIRAIRAKAAALAKLKGQLSSGWLTLPGGQCFTGLHRSVLVSGEHKRHPTFRVSLRQIQEVYNETRVFAYTTLIGAFSAIQAAWAVDYPLPQPAVDWLGKIKRIRCKKGIKPSGHRPTF